MSDPTNARGDDRAASGPAGGWSAPREFTALVDRYCDQQATPEDARELSGWLTRDRDARRFFVHYLDLHARMHWEMRGVMLPAPAEEGRSGEEVDAPPKLDWAAVRSPEGACAFPGLLPTPLEPLAPQARVIPDDAATALVPLSRKAWLWRQSLEILSSTTLFCLLVSMVLTSLGLIGLALWTVPHGPGGGGAVALAPAIPLHFSGTAGCRWQGETPKAVERGVPLELAAGLAEIAFPSGARVLLEGPALFEVTGDNTARLDHGRLIARVPPEAIGFAVETLGAEVIDLGTEFGLDVSPTGESLARVFAGSVEVRLKDASARRMRLALGEAARWNRAGVSNPVAEVWADHFVRRLPARLAPRVDLVDALLSRDGTALPRPAGLDAQGEYAEYVEDRPVMAARTGDGKFRAARRSAFVDGLFSLPAAGGELVVDSTGHAAELPRTAGVFHSIPWAVRRPDESRLTLPAGVGLTFDLESLRRASGADFARLRARGIRPAHARLDLWVLVDGVARWKLDAVSAIDDEPTPLASGKEVFEIFLPLEPRSRSLTLVAFEPAAADEPSGVVLSNPHLEVRDE